MFGVQESNSTTVCAQLGLVALDHSEKNADSVHDTSFKRAI